MKLVWSERARQDLLAIAAYIASDNPTAARAQVARLRAAARNAAEQPQIGRMVPEPGDPAVRERIVGRYRLVYQIGAQLEVLVVFEGHHRLPLTD